MAAVARKPNESSGRRSTVSSRAGLLLRQGVPPHATYLFKHALVQDAAYGTFCADPRRALHARIVEALKANSTTIAENQPELLAHHCDEAGLASQAACLWGKRAASGPWPVGAARGDWNRISPVR